MKESRDIFEVRPSELMCLICALGAHEGDDLGDPRLNEIMREVRSNPRRPVQMVCLEEQAASYETLARIPQWQTQVLRDNMIWEKVKSQFLYGLPPKRNTGVLITALRVVADIIAKPDDICRHQNADAGLWPDCPQATRDNYEKGRAKVRQLCRTILPEYYRTPEELKHDKEESSREVAAARELRIFPSHVLFLVAGYGGMLDFAEPFTVQDNFTELFRAMKANPEIPVRLVNRYCMVCPPCPSWDRQSGLCRPHAKDICVSNWPGGAVQLRLMRDWGMIFDQPLPAAKFLRKLFDVPISRMDWYWYSEGSPAGVFHYGRGKTAGFGFLDAYENLDGVVARVGKLLADRELRALLPPDDFRMMTGVLDETKSALRNHDRRKAYATITNERFWNCWKGYLEYAVVALARLPRAVRCESREQSGGLPALTARRTAKTIRCNGRLDKKEWSRAVFSAGFRTSAERPAITETAVKVLYDRDNLYVGCLCADRSPGDLKATARVGTDIMPTRKGSNVWEQADDHMLVCIQPDECLPVYYTFRINPKSAKLGSKIELAGGAQKATYLYDLEWQALVAVGRGYWSVEAIIPFKVLGAKPGRAASHHWRINFYRIVRNDLPPPSAWSYTPRVSHNQLAKYGRLQFA